MLGDAGVEPASLLELVDEADVGLGEPAVRSGRGSMTSRTCTISAATSEQERPSEATSTAIPSAACACSGSRTARPSTSGEALTGRHERVGEHVRRLALRRS